MNACDDYFETRIPPETPEDRAARLGTALTDITIGTLSDLWGPETRPMGLALRIMDAYAKECAGECLRCGKTLRALLCAESVQPRRSLASARERNWHVCDACDVAQREAQAP